jgi:periplasmic divalent cation tolerance protein
MADNPKYLLVLSTCPGSITAKQIASAVVSDNLAACVQTIPAVHSVFRWLNRTDTADEYLLLMKTTTARYEALEQKIRAMHPYELPEIVAVPITAGFDQYLSWIDNSTQIE